MPVNLWRGVIHADGLTLPGNFGGVAGHRQRVPLARPSAITPHEVDPSPKIRRGTNSVLDFAQSAVRELGEIFSVKAAPGCGDQAQQLLLGLASPQQTIQLGSAAMRMPSACTDGARICSERRSGCPGVTSAGMERPDATMRTPVGGR